MPISASDIEFYVQCRDMLPNSDERSLDVSVKPEHGKIGLLNQGATCYLNSLLQTLVNDPNFAKAVLDAPKGAPIVEELKKLITFLHLSEKKAVSSLDLLHSFGWSKSQSFEQHDIHEMYSVLVNALRDISEDLKINLNKIFEGQALDITTCPDCGYQVSSATPFLNLSVDVPDMLENKSLDANKDVAISLEKLLEMSMRPEILDVDNMWECGGCAKKVQAVISKEYKSLPDRAVIQLKRFRFDPTSRRRRKLTTAVSIPQSLSLPELLMKDASGEKYELSAIVLHTGTAMGGHYRAIIRCADTGSWFDFNDANVTPLSNKELDSLFGASGDNGCLGSTKLWQENAYLLFYDRSSSITRSDIVYNYPPEYRALVADANSDFQRLLKAQEIRSNLVDLAITVATSEDSKKDVDAGFQSMEDGCWVSGISWVGTSGRGNEYKLSISVDSSMTMQFVLEKVHEAFQKNGFLLEFPIENCRFRLYHEVHRQLLGETFGDRLTQTLTQLGLAKYTTFLLETRKMDDKPFVEHNPRDMILRVISWKDIVISPYLEFDEEIRRLKPSAQGEQAIAAHPNGDSSGSNKVVWILQELIPRFEVLVAGEEKAAVHGLQQEILQHGEKTQEIVVTTTQKMVMIHFNDRSTVELSDMTKLLRKDHGIWPGETIIVEVIDAASDDSVALQALHHSRSAVLLSFNDPNKTEDAPQYDLSLETSLDTPLHDVREKIASKLGITDLQSFHIKRAINGNQLKDDNKSLSEYGISDHGILHIQLGRGCAVGEHFVHLELEVEGELLPLAEFPVSEKWSVAQLKEALVSHWPSFFDPALPGVSTVFHTAKEKNLSLPLLTPPSSRYLRLRDGKIGQAPVLLREDRLLSRCLLGLTDGRRLLVQVLEQEEVLKPEDILVTLRTLSYAHKLLSKPIDLVISRAVSVQHLYELIQQQHFPSLLEGLSVDSSISTTDAGANVNVTVEVPLIFRHLELAKALSTGPPLTLKATSKLKWNDISWLEAFPTSVDRPPLSLRDGSILVARSRVDYEQAKAAAKAKSANAASKDGGEESGNTVPIVAGGGVAAAKSKSNIARIRAMSSQGRRNKEQGITIEVLSGQTQRGTSSSMTTVLPNEEGESGPGIRPPLTSATGSELPPSPVKQE